jgi:hypothetical protein
MSGCDERPGSPETILSSLTGVGCGDTEPGSAGVDVGIGRVSRGRHG